MVDERPLIAGCGTHPAAVALILEAIHGSTEERRTRSAQALRWLDPQEDVLLAPPEALAAQALSWVLRGRDLESRKAAAAEAIARLQELVGAEESAA